MKCIHRLFWAFALGLTLARAQTSAPTAGVEVRMRLAFAQQRTAHRTPPAVFWLTPLPGTPAVPFPAQGRYTLLQKNRMFTPHLLVVPVGSVVIFPNEDPFFHNVFSLFNGKRFDLGLYEAGSSREVTFSREGASYIFCNIHPEMSAVVLALSTPLYASADASGAFQIHNVPAGEYEMHVWVEGIPQPDLARFTRNIHIAADTGNLGKLEMSSVPQQPAAHLNKFGRPYDQDSKPAY
jgi:hypothetical protein